MKNIFVVCTALFLLCTVGANADWMNSSVTAVVNAAMNKGVELGGEAVKIGMGTIRFKGSDMVVLIVGSSGDDTDEMIAAAREKAEEIGTDFGVLYTKSKPIEAPPSQGVDPVRSIVSAEMTKLGVDVGIGTVSENNGKVTTLWIFDPINKAAYEQIIAAAQKKAEEIGVKLTIRDEQEWLEED